VRFLFIRVREYLRRARMDSRRLLGLVNPVLIGRAIQSLRPEALASEVSEGLTAEEGARRRAIQRATFAAAATYVPERIDVPMLQCLPGRPWRRLGVGHDKWSSLTNDYCEFLGPDQIAQDSMLKFPQARLIAGAIEGCVAHLSGNRPS
jgi:hypothetical protein